MPLQHSPQRGCSSVDRVLASEAKGRGFDPRQPRQLIKDLRFPSQALSFHGANLGVCVLLMYPILIHHVCVPREHAINDLPYPIVAP